MDIHEKIYEYFQDENWDAKPLFPLQTIQSMAERWGVSRQTVKNWSKRHSDFPAAIEGVVQTTEKTPASIVYPLHEVKRYERARNLI